MNCIRRVCKKRCPSIDQQRGMFVLRWHTVQLQSNHAASTKVHPEKPVVFYLNQRPSSAKCQPVMVMRAYPSSQTVILHPTLISLVMKVARRSNASVASLSCPISHCRRAASIVTPSSLYSCENTNFMQLSSTAQQLILPSDATHCELDREELMEDCDDPTTGIARTSSSISFQKSVTNVGWTLCTCSQGKSSNEHLLFERDPLLEAP